MVFAGNDSGETLNSFIKAIISTPVGCFLGKNI
jgi:hypothetical protein